MMIRPDVIARNRELTMEIIVDLVMGALFALLMYGFVFIVTYFFAGGWNRPLIPWSVTGVFVLASCFTAWREVDPLEHAGPRTLNDEINALTSSATIGVPVSSRTVPGLASLLTIAPRKLLEAWSTWRHRLPSGDATIRDAEAMLHAAASEMRFTGDESPVALDVLRRLQLVKIRLASDGAPILVLTERGRDALNGNGPR